MRKLLASTVLASTLAAPAFAGALVFEPAPEPAVTVAPAPMAPAPAPQPSWTGPYVGGQLGWGWADVDNDDGFDTDDDDLAYGVHAGYDYDLGNGFVLGGELAYNRLEAEPTVAGVGTAEIDHLARATARAGFGFGQTLVYAKGGAAWADAEATVGGVTSDGNDFGWVAGGGVEHLVTDTVSVGLEGLYHRFSDFDDTNVDLKATTVAARVSLRF